MCVCLSSEGKAFYFTAKKDWERGASRNQPILSAVEIKGLAVLISVDESSEGTIIYAFY